MLNSVIKFFTCENIADLMHLFISYSVLAKAIILPYIIRIAQKCVLTLLLLPIPVINKNHNSNSKNMKSRYKPHCLV